MSLRGQQLHEAADRQIADLAGRLSAAEEAQLSQPCPGRQKLGDGTIGAVAAHTADNYHRIAAFVAAIARTSPRRTDRHPTAAVDLDVLIARLASARVAVATIAQLSDDDLDLVPAAGGMKFADGERTLEEILTRLFNHQRHQVTAVLSAVGRPWGACPTAGRR